MKTTLLFSVLTLSLLLRGSFSYGQTTNYNAATGSGTGGFYNVHVGYYAGQISTGSFNSFLGSVSGYFNTNGSYNSFVGHAAGRTNTSGSENSFVGFEAGRSNITGYGNSFLGYRAGYNNTASGNSFLGNRAGFSNTSGLSNTFIGTAAGFSNMTGSGNSFLGYDAGHSNTGSDNSFVGTEAGFNNTTGSFNAFYGNQAGFSNGSAKYNAFFGYGAGRNNTASFNTFIGQAAGYDNTTGTANTFLGDQAGRVNTIGSGNTFLGKEAGFNNKDGSNNSFVGYHAGFHNTTGNHNAFLGVNTGVSNTTGINNVFMGAISGYSNTTGSYNAFLGVNTGVSNSTGSNNIFLGLEAGRFNTTGNNNSFIGIAAGRNNTTGHENTTTGYLANPSTANLFNANALGSRAYVCTSNSLVLGSINGVNGAKANTKVGIGLCAPAYQLQLSTNSAAKPGTSTWTVASDQKLKKDIQQFTDGLDVLQQIKPVRFKYNGKAGLPQQTEYIGVIAQEIQKIAPYMIGKFMYQDTTGKQEEYLDYDANALTYILVNSVKEQQEQMQALKEENELLKQELANIKAMILKQALITDNSVSKLGQNIPNPYDETTVIPYQIPASANSAFIKIFSTTGQEVQSFNITGKAEGGISLQASQLSAGTYIYTLFVDGQRIETKKMILSR